MLCILKSNSMLVNSWMMLSNGQIYIHPGVSYHIFTRFWTEGDNDSFNTPEASILTYVRA